MIISKLEEELGNTKAEVEEILKENYDQKEKYERCHIFYKYLNLMKSATLNIFIC